VSRPPVAVERLDSKRGGREAVHRRARCPKGRVGPGQRMFRRWRLSYPSAAPFDEWRANVREQPVPRRRPCHAHGEIR
jgi:hypothetical protein